MEVSLPALVQRLAPGRFRILWILAGLFLGLNLLVRLGLVAFNGDASLLWPWRLAPVLAIGAVFDLAVAFMGLVPLAWLLGLWPTQGVRAQRWLQRVVAALLLPVWGLVVLVAFAEFTFWNEFASRFNFIAVDYLVYTREVLGNIRESYPMPLLLAAVGATAVGLWAYTLRRLRPVWAEPPARGRVRVRATLDVLRAVLDDIAAHPGELAGDLAHAARGR